MDIQKLSIAALIAFNVFVWRRNIMSRKLTVILNFLFSKLYVVHAIYIDL